MHKALAELSEASEVTVGTFHSDANGRMVAISDAACRIIGRTREEIRTLDPSHYVHPDDLGAIYEGAIARGIVGRRPVVVAYRALGWTDPWAPDRGEPEERPVIFSLAPIIEDGAAVGFTGTVASGVPVEGGSSSHRGAFRLASSTVEAVAEVIAPHDEDLAARMRLLAAGLELRIEA